MDSPDLLLNASETSCDSADSATQSTATSAYQSPPPSPPIVIDGFPRRGSFRPPFPSFENRMWNPPPHLPSRTSRIVAPVGVVPPPFDEAPLLPLVGARPIIPPAIGGFPVTPPQPPKDSPEQPAEVPQPPQRLRGHARFRGQHRVFRVSDSDESVVASSRPAQSI